MTSALDMASSRSTLNHLVQQIAEIVSAGDDSGSQHSDGTVPMRLRQVVLTLLDQVVSSKSGERGGHPDTL